MKAQTLKTAPPTTTAKTTAAVAADREAAVRRCVADNQGLVRMVAHRLAFQYGEGLDPETREDLYNECLQNGVLGLRRAAELYDEARGSFSNYACHWIYKRAKEAADAWAEDRRHVSLDAPAGEEDDAAIGDFIMDESAEDPSEAMDRMQQVEVLRELLNELPARDRAMVEMRYGSRDGRPAPFSEIGAAFHVSMQRAERIVKRTISRLRVLARERDFDPAA